jgi:hypothetical protein
MKRLGFLLAWVSVFFVLPHMPNRAAAQSTDQGVLNAVSYLPLPRGAAIAVRPLDDTDDNLILQHEFEQRLRAQGYVVSADAALVLTFETRNEIGAWSDAGQRRPLELKQSRAASGIQDPQVQLNLYDSSRGGVFNEGRGRTAITTPGRYRLDASIDDRTNGQRLWQGWSVADLGAFDSLQLTRAMVPAIVGSVGQTLKRQPFDLP